MSTPDDSDPLVDVLCRAAKGVVYTVHKDYLVQSSRYFEEEIRAAERNTNLDIGKVTIACRYDSEVFGMFFRSLYSESIRPFSDDTTEEMLILAKAYKFGEILNTSEFADNVMDCMIEMISPYGHNLSTGSILRPILRMFPAGKVRALMVEWLVLGYVDAENSSHKHVEREPGFCRELAGRFMEVKLKEETAARYYQNRCFYHLHNGTDKCE